MFYFTRLSLNKRDSRDIDNIGKYSGATIVTAVSRHHIRHCQRHVCVFSAVSCLLSLLMQNSEWLHEYFKFRLDANYASMTDCLSTFESFL